MTQDAKAPNANTDFDIGSLDTVVEATFQVAVISDSEGNPKSGFLVAGKNSDAYRSVAHKMRVDGLMRASRRKALLDSATQEGAEAMANIIAANDTLLATTVVIGWFGFANNGVAAPFDAAVAKRMLLKFPTWQQKVLEALENDANFTKG